jgi:hypothetical protein
VEAAAVQRLAASSFKWLQVAPQLVSRLPTYLLPAGRTIFGAPFPEAKQCTMPPTRAVTDGGASAPFVEAQSNFFSGSEHKHRLFLLLMLVANMQLLVVGGTPTTFSQEGHQEEAESRSKPPQQKSLLVQGSGSSGMPTKRDASPHTPPTGTHAGRRLSELSEFEPNSSEEAVRAQNGGRILSSIKSYHTTTESSCSAAGYDAITSYDDCLAAANSLVLPFYGDSASWGPSGCFLDGSRERACSLQPHVTRDHP